MSEGFHERPRNVAPESAGELAERAHIEARSVIGAREIVLDGGQATFELSRLEQMDDHGLMMIFGLGDTAAKLYKHHIADGRNSYYITSADYTSEEPDGRAQVINFTELVPGKFEQFGSEAKYARALGLKGNQTVSPNHIGIKVSHGGQLEVADLSAVGTRLIVKEQVDDSLANAVDRFVLGRYFGRVILDAAHPDAEA